MANSPAQLPRFLNTREFIVIRYERLFMGDGRLLMLLDDRSSHELGLFSLWEEPVKDATGWRQSVRMYLVNALGGDTQLVEDAVTTARNFGMAMVIPSERRVINVNQVKPGKDEKALIAKMFKDDGAYDMLGPDWDADTYVESRTVGSNLQPTAAKKRRR